MLNSETTNFFILKTIPYIFPTLMALIILWIIGLYIIDKFQRRSTLRRNYPILARFRYLFEHMGTFFRQYFFALDREEMPFNRAERSWAYRAAKNVDSTVAFGSTKNLRAPGTVFFVNCFFPTLSKDAMDTSEIIFGPHTKHPYKTNSIFHISGMSYGAISIPAVRALAKGAKLAGILLNTGEGGLSPYHLESGCDLIFQIGTAKFGVRKKDGGFDKDKLAEIGAKPEVKMFEIKLSQGAKPGKGGILPGAKVTEEVAKIRGIEVGMDAISPNRHPEIKDMESLLDMVNMVRDATGKPAGIKCVIGNYDFFNDLCKAIKKRGEKSAPDFISLDSSDGGTGAAPMSLIDNMGIPIKESLPEVIDILRKHKLKDRILVGASGKLITPSEVAWAIAAGADFASTARGFMFALGCIQALQCNKNNCPTGITTHDEKLQYGLDPENKSVRVANYANNMEKEVKMIAYSCGVKEVRSLRRKHVRIVCDEGRSRSMDEIYPEKD